MLYKFQGETIRPQVVVKDYDGTALNSETLIFHFEDATGSNIHNGTGTFDATGSYYHQTQIGANWGTGPVRYWVTVDGANGSAQAVRTNELYIMEGTSELPSYVYEAELPQYYDRITDYDANVGFKIHERYNYINRLLEALNIKAPRNKNDDGQYDQSLRSMNAWFAIYDIVAEDQVNRVPSDEEPWYMKFWYEGTRIYEDIRKKRIVFRDQVSPSEAGISPPTRTAGSSIGTLRNNWDNTWGGGFTGDDFERKWILEIIGASTDLGTAKARWTKDGGITYATMVPQFSWNGLADGVYVRFDIGTATGTAGIFQVGDKWGWNTIPKRKSVGGMDSAKSY